MEYLAKCKKEVLRVLCNKLGLTVLAEMKIAELRNFIVKHPDYDEGHNKQLP